ncbi:MAG: hypothetical protein J5829_00775 [Lachnospiraceae bacterium]|nr:hypothetical protein [Lachnospiraceae bacterium]
MINNTIYGEYDNYDYSSVEGMSIDEQIVFTKKALKSAIRLSQNNKNEYWEKKISEIKEKLKQLENESGE